MNVNVPPRKHWRLKSVRKLKMSSVRLVQIKTAAVSKAQKKIKDLTADLQNIDRASLLAAQESY